MTEEAGFAAIQVEEKREGDPNELQPREISRTSPIRPAAFNSSLPGSGEFFPHGGSVKSLNLNLNCSASKQGKEGLDTIFASFIYSDLFWSSISANLNSGKMLILWFRERFREC